VAQRSEEGAGAFTRTFDMLNQIALSPRVAADGTRGRPSLDFGTPEAAPSAAR